MAPSMLLLFLLSEAASDVIVVAVYPGDDVILPCQAAERYISTVKWSRPDLEPDTVLLSRDGHLKTDDQHPSFKDRVELVDRDLKDRDVSLILKNVNINDTGTYKCGVKTGGTVELIIRIIHLQVREPGAVVPGSKDGNSSPVGLYLGLAAGGLAAGVPVLLLLVAVVAVVGVRKYKRRPIVVTVEAGDDAILPFKTKSSISIVQWSRPDLKPDTVLVYLNGVLYPTDQHTSFKGRVELVDRDLKDGDVSLILKNVSKNDTGTYQCYVREAGSERDSACFTSEPIRTVRLQVTEPGPPRKETPLL